MLTCPNPECHSQKGGIYIDKADNLRPSMWNGCCSPECGEFVAGLLYANPDHPAASQQRFNRDALDRWEEWVRAEVKSCPEHDWVEDRRRHYTVFEGGKTTRRAGLRCAACPARRAGDEIKEAS